MIFKLLNSAKDKAKELVIDKIGSSNDWFSKPNTKKHMQVGAAVYLLASVLADIYAAISTDGFQFSDLYPMLTMESLGAVVFIGYFIKQIIKTRKEKNAKDV